MWCILKTSPWTDQDKNAFLFPHLSLGAVNMNDFFKESAELVYVLRQSVN